MAFARTAPVLLVAEAIESMVDDVVDATVGPFRLPFADGEQLVAPWACTESFWESLKRVCIQGRVFATRAEARRAIFRWVN